MSKLFIIRQGIDLGDEVHGVFTTCTKAVEALEKMQKAYEAKMGQRLSDLTLAEFEADEIVCESWWWKSR